MHYFSRFFKKIKLTMREFFALLDEKHTVLKILRKPSTIVAKYFKTQQVASEESGGPTIAPFVRGKLLGFELSRYNYEIGQKSNESSSYSTMGVFSQFNKACGQVLRLWTKNAIYRKVVRGFSTIFKSFLRILLKRHYVSIFSKQVNKLCVSFFAGLHEKDNLLEISRKFSKILKIYLQNIAKNALFQQIFQIS